MSTAAMLPRRLPATTHAPAKPPRNREYLSFVVPVLAVVLLIAFCRHDNPADVGALGLITVMPKWVFVLAAIVFISFVVELRRSRLRGWALAAHIFAIAMLTHGIASLLEVEPRFPTAYLHAGITEVIIHHRHPVPGLDSRFSWPGFFTAMAALVGMSNLDTAVKLIRWAPLVFNLAYCFPVFVLAREFLRSSRRAWLVVALFLLTQWVGQDYYSPQAYGYLLFLCVLAVVVTTLPGAGRTLERLPGFLGRLYNRLLTSGVGRSPTWSFGQQVLLLSLLVASAVAMSMEHQLTPVVLTVDLMALAVLGLVSAGYVSLVFLVATVAWISYGAIAFWSGHLGALFGSGGASALQQNVGGHFTGGAGHRMVLDGRVAFTLLVWLAAAAAVIRRVIKRKRTNLIALALALVPFPIVLAQAYGGEASLRLFLFTLPFMLVLFAAGFPSRLKLLGRWRSAVLVGCLTVLLPAFWVACYGNEQFEQATKSDIAASQFLYGRAAPGATFAVINSSVFVGYERYAQYQYASADADNLTSLKQLTPAQLLKHLAPNPAGVYLMITPAQKSYGIQNYGFPDDWVSVLRQRLAGNDRFKVIYDRNGSYIYKVKPLASGQAGASVAL